jgi:hypothetical protein
MVREEQILRQANELQEKLKAMQSSNNEAE